MSDKFINQEDPTKALDLQTISLESQFAKLTESEKIDVFLKIFGYTHRPPTIERLYSDEYYLGSSEFYSGGSSIFQHWKDTLPSIFPSEVLTAKPYLVLSGAIGIGKSTISKICLANTYARLACMADPYKVLRIAPKPLSAVIFHRSEETAKTEFKYWFEKVLLEKSPFFKNPPNTPDFKVMTSGPRGSGGIGSDVIFFLMGEVNFWDNPEKAIERVYASLIRFKNRFGIDEITKVGQFIVDSSAKGASGPTEIFLENTDPRYTYHCRPSHWEVRPEMYTESEGITFPVYLGDGRVPPQILESRDHLAETMDTDRVLDVPIQLKGEFRAALIKSLQDLAGQSTGESDSFFGGSISHLISCSKKKNLIPEIVKVDFYDKEERIMDKVEPAVREIPPGTFLFLGLDLGVVEDTTGISACSFSHWENWNGTRVPFITNHFTFGVTRHNGQETSLFHIEQFILELSRKFGLIVSADQAFSKNLLQNLEREGIETRYISTDRTNEPAFYLKSIINRQQIELPFVKRLQREALDLKLVGLKRKVDHPKHASISSHYDNPDGKQSGSKDLWDALSSSAYSLNLSVIEGLEMGYSSGFQRQGDILASMTKNAQTETTKKFQHMLEDYWDF